MTRSNSLIRLLCHAIVTIAWQFLLFSKELNHFQSISSLYLLVYHLYTWPGFGWLKLQHQCNLEHQVFFCGKHLLQEHWCFTSSFATSMTWAEEAVTYITYTTIIIYFCIYNGGGSNLRRFTMEEWNKHFLYRNLPASNLLSNALYFGRRHTPFVNQPDYRIYELNKRLQHRAEVSLWWHVCLSFSH